MVMVERARKRRSRGPSHGALAIYLIFSLQLLTYCAGKSEEEEDSSKGGSSNSGASNGGASTGGVSTGGVSTGGFAGHTGQCIGDPCAPGCALCAGRGGTSSGGTSSGGAGFGGQGGSFAGHTGICFMNPCAGGCWTPSCGGAGQGGTSNGGAGTGGLCSGGDSCGGRGGTSNGGAGFAGQGGSFAGHTGICFMNPCSAGCWQPACGGFAGGGSGGGGSGGAGAGGAGAGGAGSGGGGAGGAAQRFASEGAEAPRSVRGCYPLSGYEGDPCLPPDDGLLAWLDDKPAQCEPHVTVGPFGGFDGQSRTCCYTVACRDASLPAPNGLIHGPR